MSGVGAPPAMTGHVQVDLSPLEPQPVLCSSYLLVDDLDCSVWGLAESWRQLEHFPHKCCLLQVESCLFDLPFFITHLGLNVALKGGTTPLPG